MAKVGEFEECVAIDRNGSYYGTGVIVPHDIVLTAAHFWDGDPGSAPDSVWLGIATPDTQMTNPKGRQLDVIRYYCHEQYQFDRTTGAPEGNDLLLLQLSPKARSEIKVHAVVADASAYQRTNQGGKTVRAVRSGNSFLDVNYEPKGWGVKRYVTIPMAPEDAARYGLHEADVGGVKQAMEFVAASKNEKADTCEGDSGGPINYVEDCIFKLVGLASRSTPGAEQVCGHGGI